MFEFISHRETNSMFVFPYISMFNILQCQVPFCNSIRKSGTGEINLIVELILNPYYGNLAKYFATTLLLVQKYKVLILTHVNGVAYSLFLCSDSLNGCWLEFEVLGDACKSNEIFCAAGISACQKIC